MLPGHDVASVPQDMHALYREARACVAANAYTASVLIARKILMHLAVEKGAIAGAPFTAYVDFLATAGYVPPKGRGWVDHIRSKSNEAHHEIVLMTRADAEDLLTFIEMLLKFIFEFPAKLPPAP